MKSRFSNYGESFERVFRASSKNQQVLFSKDIIKSKACRDFYRMCSHIRIEKQSDEDHNLFTSHEFKSDGSDLYSRIVEVLNTLVDCVHWINDKDEFKKISVDELKESVQNFNNYSALTKFLITKYGKGSTICRLIRLCHQAFVIGVVSNFTLCLHNAVGKMIKDSRIKGRWKIVYRFKKYGKKQISCVHRRIENCHEAGTRGAFSFGKLLFNFNWEVQFIFNTTEMKMIDGIKANILEIDWIEKKNEKDEVEFRKVFGKPSTRFNQDEIEEEQEQEQDDIEEKNEKTKKEKKLVSRGILLTACFALIYFFFFKIIIFK